MILFTPSKAFAVAFAFTLASMWMPVQTRAQYVTIPDPNFVTWLQNNGYAGCMNGNQLDTTCPEVENATSLDCSESYISDLTGIQYFDNLTLLYCITNQLTSLPPLPAGLETLYCGNNYLLSLPDLPSTLTHLSCATNNLEFLPDLPDGLIMLTCGENYMSNLSDLPGTLTSLACNDNILVSLPTLPAGLITLYCGNLIQGGVNQNQIASLPDLPVTLYDLYCQNMPALTSLPALPASLNFLDVTDDINLKCLPPLNNIQFLYIRGSAIACVPSPNNLVEIDMGSDFPVCGTLAISSQPDGLGGSLLSTNYSQVPVAPYFFETTPFFHWSNGATASTTQVVDSGTYDVTVNEGSACEEVASIVLADSCTILMDIDITYLGNGADTCALLPALLDAGSGYSQYQWATGETTQTIVVDQGGFYLVTVTDANGCTGTNYVEDVSFIPVWIEAYNQTTLSPIIGDVCPGTPVTLVALSSVLNLVSFDWYDQAIDSQFYDIGFSYESTAGDFFIVNAHASNGCVYGKDIMIGLLPAPEVTVQAQADDCDLTVVSLDATVTGEAPFTYLWDNGATTLSTLSSGSGPHTVSVTDANGCTASAGATAQAGTLLLSVEIANDTCSDASGVVTVSVTGGTAPYFYEWSDGSAGIHTSTDNVIDSLSAGEYSIWVTDANGCAANIIASVIAVYDPPYVNLNDAYYPWCEWQTAMVEPDVIGNAPFSYLWNYGQTTSSVPFDGFSGYYSVWVSDANGCTGYDEAFISTDTLALNPGAVEIQGDPNCTPGLALMGLPYVTDGTPPYSFQWSNGETTQFIVIEPAVYYDVTVSDANGCSIVLEDYRAGFVVNADSIAGATCGEANGLVDISTDGDYSGFTFLWSNGATTADATGLTAGTYTVTVTPEFNGCTVVETFVVPQTSDVDPPVLDVSYSSGCNPLPAIISVTGTYESYLWSTNETTSSITANDNGTYSVTITNAGGCTAADEVVINVSPATQVLISGDTLVCYGATTLLSVSSGVEFIWSDGSTDQSITVPAGVYSVTVTDLNGCSSEAQVEVEELNPLYVDIVELVTACDLITVELNAIVAGGLPPYSYLWHNGATAAGIIESGSGPFSVTVTDANGCSVSDSAIVSFPPPEEFPLLGDTSICPGSFTTLTAPMDSLTYLWSTGETTSSIDVATAGPVFVEMLSPQGCLVAIGYANVIEHDVPVLSTFVTDAANGNDGAIDLVVTGAGSPYNYIWSNGMTTEDVSGLAAGDYSVTVTTADGCNVYAYATVSQSTGCTLTVNVTGVNPSCHKAKNGTATATVNGGTPPYTYDWSNNKHTSSIFNLRADTYSVTVTDNNGCTATGEIILAHPEPLQAYTTSTKTCPGFCSGTASLNIVGGGTPPYTFIWEDGSTLANASDLCAGVHWVTVTDANGCKKIIGAHVTPSNPSACVGANPQKTENEASSGQGSSVNGISVYPNPTDGRVKIQLYGNETVSELLITNMLGQIIYRSALSADISETSVDLNGLVAGVYTLSWETTGRRETVKLIKQ